MSERLQGPAGRGVRVHARGALPVKHPLTAALMAGFFLVANGLALAWTLTEEGPYMERAIVIALVAVSTLLVPVTMWGVFKLPRLAIEVVIGATTALVAGAIFASGNAGAPLAFLFLWAIPYTMAFFTGRQAAVQIGLVALACAAAFAGVHARVHGTIGLSSEDALRWAFVVATELALATLVLRMRNALRASSRRLRQRAAQQAAVSELGQRALSELALGPLLSDAVEMVAQTLALDLVTVLELHHEQGTMLMRAGYGWPPGLIGSEEVPFDERSQAALAIRTEAPVVVDDYASETRFPGAPVLLATGAVSGIDVPIRGHGNPYGVLAAHAKSVRVLSADDVDFLQSVANVLAAAIERRRVEAITRHQALHDPLTGLPNRALFRDRLQHALARSRRRAATLAVLFLDVDNFKFVNDSLGHEAGDELLTVIAPRLAEAVRTGDTVARFGGDEFVLLCEDIVDEQEALEIADRVKRCFARPIAIAGGEHMVTASIGVALPARGHDTPESLLRDADAAMYQAKQRGRARFEVFDADMRASVVKRLEIEADLRHALERGEMRLAFQPVIEIASGRIAAVEALARWHHPERGIVAPNDFIPVAEESGLIVPLGRWVMHEAMRKAVHWSRIGSPAERPPVVSLNVSARQMAEPGLIRSVAEGLAGTQVDPRLIALEITETVLVEDSVTAAETLRALEQLGVRLVLDDFGTGYSSLGYVKRFPLSFLKIDRSFVAELGSNRRDAAIVSAIVEMSRALGVRVVAEGVETEEQLELVQQMGCELAQGFLFSRPISADEVDSLILTRPWERRSGQAARLG